MMGGFGGYGMTGFGTIGMILNLVITVGLVIGVILLIVWAVKRLGPNGQGATTQAASASPRDVLQLRYARGEITREQYQQMLADVKD